MNWFNEDGSIDYDRYSAYKDYLLVNQIQPYANFNVHEVNNDIQNKILETVRLYESFKKINKNMPDMVFDNLDTNIDGYYNPKENTLYININGKSPFREVLKHELTHGLKGTEYYQKLLDYSLSALKNSNEYDSLRKQVENQYANELNNLDTQERENYINEELLSIYSERLFSNQNAINTLVNKNRPLAQRIYSWIKGKINRLTGKLSPEDVKLKKELTNVERLYTKALKSNKIVDNNQQMDYNQGRNKSKGGFINDTSRIQEYDTRRIEKVLQRREESIRENELLQRRDRRRLQQSKTILSSETELRQRSSEWDNSRDRSQSSIIEVSSDDFYNNFTREYKSLNKNLFVEVHDKEFYKNCKTFLKPNGKAGIAIEPNGNIVSVFNNDTERGWTKTALIFALQNGGNHLDCYNDIKQSLPILYSRYGFIPVAKIKFIDKFAPKGWNYELWGRPDIVFMVHNGDNVHEVINNIDKYPIYNISKLEYSPDYETAKQLQLNKLNETIKQKNNKYKFNSKGEELSKSQQEFFKDSVVRDGQGRLLVVYHGTNNEFTTFDKTKLGSNTFAEDASLGFHLTNGKEMAKQFGKNIMELYVNIKKPLDFTKNLSEENYQDIANVLNVDIDELKENIETATDFRELQDLKNELASDKKLISGLRKLGYDGIIFGIDKGIVEYIAFEPNQIKSIDNLNPTDSDDVRFKKSDNIPPNQMNIDDFENLDPNYNPIAKVEKEVVKTAPNESKKKTPPKSETKTIDTKESRFQAKSVPEWAIDNMLDKETVEKVKEMKSYYVPETDKKSLEYINRELVDLDKNYETYVENYITNIENNNIKSKKDIALGIALVQESVKRKDWDNYFRLSSNLTILGTELGQQVQAFSLLNKLTENLAESPRLHDKEIKRLNNSEVRQTLKNVI